MPTVEPPEGRASERALAVPGRTLLGLRAGGRFLLRLPALLALVLTVLWGSLIWSLSARHVPLPSGGSAFWELVSNLAHAPLFGLLGLFLATLLLRGDAGEWPRFHARSVALVLALVVTYGAIDEWHQSHVPGRDASPLDIVTDLTGASLVLWIAAYLGRHGASERGLWLRLLAGLVLCVAAAGLALTS
jgi:VanZ family protein